MTALPDIRPESAEELIEVRLVPVQVFGTEQCCQHNPHGALIGANPDNPEWTDCESQGYGLSDAVSAWSDCNRAVGHIYRFEDIEVHREPGETLTVWVKRSEYEAFAARNFDREGN